MARLLSVGFYYPGCESLVQFESKQSLLDADTIFFTPHLGRGAWSSNTYLGKPSLSEDISFRVKEQVSHWRRELADAFNTGKTIFVFLKAPLDVWVATGKKEYSGTGRNRQVTDIVERLSSYDCLPLKLNHVTRQGADISPASDLGPLALYWKEFAAYSRYEVTIESEPGQVLLHTSRGDKAVGKVLSKPRGGVLVLLPSLVWDERSFTKIQGKQEYWNAKGLAFGRRLEGALLEASRALSIGARRGAEPEWAKEVGFSLPSQARLQSKLETVEKRLERAQRQRTQIAQDLEEAAIPKGLLYERGKPLEEAIITALCCLGFKAEGFQEGDSQFDIVFSSREGRFLGEAEGKDNKAIGIDKLSQLERNLHEDFARSQVRKYAKGVLFGNAHRLTVPAKRGPCFTQKCISGAKRTSIALVRTADLFAPVRYLLETDDKRYAKRCRLAIAQASGEVASLPSPPDL